MTPAALAALDTWVLKGARGDALPDAESDDSTAADQHDSAAAAERARLGLRMLAVSLGARSWDAAVCHISDLHTTPAPTPTVWRRTLTTANLDLLYPAPKPQRLHEYAVLIPGALWDDNPDSPDLYTSWASETEAEQIAAKISEWARLIGEPGIEISIVRRTTTITVGEWETYQPSAKAATDA